MTTDINMIDMLKVIDNVIHSLVIYIYFVINCKPDKESKTDGKYHFCNSFIYTLLTKSALA